MTDRRRHAPNLAVLSFDQFQLEPGSWHGLANANRRIARRRLGIGLNQTCDARFGFSLLDGWASLKFLQRFRRWNALNLRPINSWVLTFRIEQARVQPRLIAKQQQPFRISVQSSERINTFRKRKFRERAIGRTIRRELRKRPVWFVERDQHSRIIFDGSRMRCSARRACDNSDSRTLPARDQAADI